MGHQLRNDQPDWISHITARINWRAWHLANKRAKRLLIRLLRESSIAFAVRIFAGVLMSNHLHLVAQSPPAPLFRTLTGRRTRCRHFRPYPAGHQKASVLAQFMKSVRHRMSIIWQRELELSGRFWEGEYDARPIESFESFCTRVAYDHRNPVKQGMVERPEDYPWSSAEEWVTGVPGVFPITPLTEPIFGASPEEVRDTVLVRQASPKLQEVVEELGPRWWARSDVSADELRALFRKHDLACARGSDAANR